MQRVKNKKLLDVIDDFIQSILYPFEVLFYFFVIHCDKPFPIIHKFLGQLQLAYYFYVSFWKFFNKTFDPFLAFELAILDMKCFLAFCDWADELLKEEGLLKEDKQNTSTEEQKDNNKS